MIGMDPAKMMQTSDGVSIGAEKMIGGLKEKGKKVQTCCLATIFFSSSDDEEDDESDDDESDEEGGVGGRGRFSARKRKKREKRVRTCRNGSEHAAEAPDRPTLGARFLWRGVRRLWRRHDLMEKMEKKPKRKQNKRRPGDDCYRCSPSWTFPLYLYEALEFSQRLRIANRLATRKSFNFVS